MRARDAREYIESVYRERVENLMREVRKELPEDYVLFSKIRSYYVKIDASGSTIYTRLTKLRSACWFVRTLFGRPLRELTRDEWEEFSTERYSRYNSKDSIVGVIHPLRLALKYLGYSEKDVKELFPYPSSVHAKMKGKSPPPYVPEEVGVFSVLLPYNPERILKALHANKLYVNTKARVRGVDLYVWFLIRFRVKERRRILVLGDEESAWNLTNIITRYHRGEKVMDWLEAYGAFYLTPFIELKTNHS